MNIHSNMCTPWRWYTPRLLKARGIFVFQEGDQPLAVFSRRERTMLNRTSKQLGKQISLDWFKGKFTGNHGFYHQI